MKKLAALLLSVTLLGLSVTTGYAADEQATEAKVIKVTGAATVLLPGQAEAVALTAGMNIPVGATLTTGAGAQVELQALAGGFTTISQNSTVIMEELSVQKDRAGVVTQQTAILNLKSGNLVSTLDPANKRINNYGVRTPKGVAAARGTTYTVSVSQTGTHVATMSGRVTLTPVGGGTPIVIDIGTGVVVGQFDASGKPVTLAQLIAAEAAAGTGGDAGSFTTAIAQAVTSVSAAVSSGTITSGDSAITLLASVVRVASEANPDMAVDYARTAFEAVVSKDAATTGGGMGVLSRALETISESAAYGAGLAMKGRSAFASEAAAYISSDINQTMFDTLYASDYPSLVPRSMAYKGADNAMRVKFRGANFNKRSTQSLDGISTPITPIDVSVISPSGGN